MPDEWLITSEAAEISGYHPEYLRKLLQSRKLTGKKFGTTWRVSQNASRDGSGIVIDALAYGSGLIPGQLSCPLVIASGRALERNPYWRDSDSCPDDFLNWTLPTPGVVRELVNPHGSDPT